MKARFLQDRPPSTTSAGKTDETQAWTGYANTAGVHRRIYEGIIKKKPWNHDRADCRNEEMADTVIPEDGLDDQKRSKPGERPGWRSYAISEADHAFFPYRNSLRMKNRKPMHMQPIYRMNPFVTVEGNGRGRSSAYFEGEGIDVGADVFRRGLCLPSDNKMTPEQQNVIIEIIHRCFR